MGSGIAQVSTEVAKKNVILLDTSLSIVEKAKSNIGMSLMNELYSLILRK